MRDKTFFSYRLFIWMLLLIAMILGGGYLIIAYSYNLQKETEKRIDAARHSVVVAKEMEIELIRLRGFTFTYLVDKSRHWLDSINAHQVNFIIYLEKARQNANTPEEKAIINQISGLFANYEQNLIRARRLVRQRDYNQANILLVHSAKDLIDTIHDKCRHFIALNIQAEEDYELNIARTNNIIIKAMVSLGAGGIIFGLLLGWIISRILIAPINQLILQVRGAPSGAILEKLSIPRSGDLDELGNRIKDLIRQINKAQHDLEKNKQLLQYSNKYAVLGKVAPTIAHEIRNPLAAIKMLVYSMKENDNRQETNQQDLEIISDEIDRMEGFIKNFLRFTRPSEEAFKPLHPVRIIQDLMLLLSPKIRKNSIELIDTTPTHKDVMVLGDAGQLKQLFMNLIINAVDIMPDGGTLYLSTDLYTSFTDGQEQRVTDFLTIHIEDTGPGIPLHILNHLFEPFIRGTEHGVGLGLSISQSIASFHKGWIEAKNKEPGKGASFIVYLPVISP